MSPSRALVALSLALCVRSVAADPVTATLPFAPPERPFLLVDAPRRFLPGEGAFVRVQNQYGGPVQIGVFRLHAVQSFVAEPIDRQGVSIASGPVGAEAEALLLRDGPMPRVGGSVDLVSLRRVVLQARAPVRRAVGNETAAYDSNELNESQTETWGVDAGDWTDENVSLGALPAGVYLVRALAGGWASTALVSVSPLTVLARRGDARDLVVVTDAEGVPQRGVTVQRFVAGRPGERAVTDAQGAVSMAAVDAHEARYVAVQGDAVAWADVTHVRAETCDVRVYLGVGRPAFRPGETVNVRGHARGCVEGRDVPLRDEPVELFGDPSGEAVATARTDSDGNFTAEVPASGELFARVRGRDHRRTLHLDSRPLPRRSLNVRFDRAWAAAGEAVTVFAADSEGGWPDDAVVTFRTPAGVGAGRIGPHRAASFTFTMPATEEPLARRTVRAEVSTQGATTYAEGELWTGATRDLLELTSEQSVGAAGQELPVELSLRDLGGHRHDGTVVLRVFATDGNRPTGPARWSRALRVSAEGARPRVTLSGTGPWWIEASPDGSLLASRASIVVWERPRPPSLSARGALAVDASGAVVSPGQSLPVTLRAPAAGSTLLTLEQSGVWAARSLAVGAAGRFELPVAEGARGNATVVATHVHAGEVTSASAAVEVESSRRFGLRVSTSERTYATGAHARVTLTARNVDGTARDAVVSLWVADAGWWDLADEDHPPPDAYFRLPGRRASAGDSAHPRGYGAEEGRRLDTAIEWNGQRLPATTFRHAWGHRTELLRFDMEGSFGDVARRMARDAGLDGAVVCASAEQRLGRVHAKLTSAPWDMAAVRIALATDTHTYVDHGVLQFACGQSGFGGVGGSGMGQGGGGGRGVGSVGHARSQHLDGTVFFLGARRLGPTGSLTLDVPLPEHPGRWRFEALAIADDGAGALAHAFATTTQPVEARVELPPAFSLGDVVDGALAVSAPSLAGQRFTLDANTSRGLRFEPAAPTSVMLDAEGRGSVPVTVRALDAGDQLVTFGAVSATDATRRDRVQFSLGVRHDPARIPAHVDATVGPEASDVELRVPPLTTPATLDLRVGGGLVEGVNAALDALREPRWNLASLRLDRASSLRALSEALRGTEDVAVALLRAEVERAFTGEWAALSEHLRSSGGVAWWGRMRSSPWLTSELLSLGEDRLSEDDRRAALEVVRAALVNPRSSLPLQARAAEAVTVAVRASDARVAIGEEVYAALDRVLAGDTSLDALTHVLRVARITHDAPRARRAATALAASLDRALANHPEHPCAGVHWLLCAESLGDRSITARAATELLRDNASHAPLAARALAWIVRHQTIAQGPHWGSSEADVLALQSALPAGASTRDAVVRFEGRELTRIAPGSSARVTVPGEGVLTVSFEREATRSLRVRIDGELHAVAPTTVLGPGALSHRIETVGGVATMVAEFTLPAASRGVSLDLPLPAAYALGARAGGDDARASGGRGADRWGFDLDGPWDFYALDRTPTQPRPRIEQTDGALRVRYRGLLPGRHRLLVPLTTVAHGRFHAGPAQMRSDEGVWSVSPGLDAEVR
jgi:hypothetical protein